MRHMNVDVHEQEREQHPRSHERPPSFVT
jgi:hypothetical protein